MSPHTSDKNIRYVRRASNGGWTLVHLTIAQKTFRLGKPEMSNNCYLCEYTKVKLTKEEKSQQFFTIIDGYNGVGLEASMHKEHADKYLVEKGPELNPALVNVRYIGEPTLEVSPFKGKLLQQWGELSVSGVVKAKITLNSYVNSKYTPIPPGHHLILAPDNSHMENANTGGYAQVTPGMVGNDVWFAIGLNNGTANSSRYIHVGHLSDGCVTCHQLEQWTPLYNYLISHRMPNTEGKLVGHLEVTK